RAARDRTSGDRIKETFEPRRTRRTQSFFFGALRRQSFFVPFVPFVVNPSLSLPAEPPMPSTDHLLAFLLATLIFAAIPGPGILYTAAQTLARGRAGGLMAALGIHLGGYLHVAAAALGLA